MAIFNRKIHFWITGVGIIVFILSALLIIIELIVGTDILNLRGTPIKIITKVGVVALIAPYGYLLCSALLHFKKKLAIWFWIGSILLAPAWSGVIFLLFQGDMTLFTLVLVVVVAVVPVVALVAAAVVKRDMRYGWGAAAAILGLASGTGLINALIDNWDVFLITPAGYLPFLLAFCLFIAVDLAVQYRQAENRKRKTT